VHHHRLSLGFTVVSLSVALEEVLKALAEKNNNQPGPWLEEVEDLATRGRARSWHAQYRHLSSSTVEHELRCFDQSGRSPASTLC